MPDLERRRARADRLLLAQRNYRRVRDRALAKLANKHKDEYLALLEEEKAYDKAQGKTWVDIAGNTESSLGLLPDRTQPNGEATASNTGDYL